MRLLSSFMATLAAVTALPAAAQESLEIIGKPIEKGIGFQPAVTELSQDIQWLDGMVLVIITLITLFVCALMAVCIVRYNKRANPTAASFTHNSPIEVAWTVIPIVVLLFIGVYSLPVLFKQQEFPEGEVHIKVIGHQWYWTYEYTDNEFEFDSYMIGQPATGGNYILDDGVEEQLAEAGYGRDEFLLATDTAVVVPVGKDVVMTVTADDVIHSWTIPAFGVKQDAVPGRLAQLWFNVEQEGIYFGQCSELCGKDHTYMPITVKAVSQEAYEAWINTVKEADEYVDVASVN